VSAVDLACRVASNPRAYALGDAGESADAAALTSYRARYEDLEELLAEAKKNGDFAAQERYQNEMAKLVEEIERHRGLGGRKRKASDDRDRVRKAVGNAVRRGVEQIASYDKGLAAHLSPPRLSCGHDLRYDPGTDICWET
jgi:hypothetical protein